jgi:hypothetical protein
MPGKSVSSLLGVVYNPLKIIGSHCVSKIYCVAAIADCAEILCNPRSPTILLAIVTGLLEHDITGWLSDGINSRKSDPVIVCKVFPDNTLDGLEGRPKR